jgi:two-component system response regulator MprA
MAEAALLLVDDDASIRRMLERTLSAEGYDMTAVADGGAALAGVERSMPDLIVLDVAMPGVDGLAVTHRLRGKGSACRSSCSRRATRSGSGTSRSAA